MISRIRRSLYRAARVLGDVEAVAHGPEAMARRMVRKAVYRRAGMSAALLVGWMFHKSRRRTR